MRSLYLLILGVLFTFCGDNKTQETPEVALWKDQAEKITVKRDKYGIAHVFGKSDADAVFGMIYAQCEDDFNRVEMNYLTALGRLAEAEGEEAIYNDVRQKLFIDDDELKEMYNTSEEWLKDLMDAWAAGINYFLYVHKDVKPKVITYFEPWMALSFSEGSIGGDIESVSLKDLKDFYENKEVAALSSSFYQSEPWEKFIEEPRGSNGISISPKNTKDGKTLFLINPHTSFFFRDEIHVISEDGLDAYGAVTWGQFFV
ncbi:MAG: penicillin acylase family protein, partial [Cyclobacteriaceae bacterium]|nr:penicillin acylase family protein [Cyclobacteriaceae bacterium]